MKLKSLVIAATGILFSTIAFSQETEKIDTLDMLTQRVTQVEDAVAPMKKLVISGYFQPEWQSTQLDSLNKRTQDAKVGADRGPSDSGSSNRFGIRRGRLKATYTDFGCVGVAEFEITEKSVAVKNLNVSVLDPWFGVLAVKGGVFDRPFGYELSYSSSKLESPERSRIVQALFPDESDLGTQLTLQAPKTSPWNVVKLEAGLFSGNAIAVDNDNKKDFIAHLSYNNSITSDIKIGFGASLYEGLTSQTDTNIYVVNNGAFLRNTGTKPLGFAKREYIGFDAQFSMASVIGLSTIRAEYILGEQPGTSSSFNSPKSGSIPGLDGSNNLGASTSTTTYTTVANTAPATGYTTTAKTTTVPYAGAPTYIRSMAGGYITFVQDIMDTKHSIVLKYDWLDPNTKLTGSQIGVGAKTSKADMAYSTIGFGYSYRMNNNVKISAYYDIVSNEKTKVTGYFSDVKDNLTTIRMQYKF